MVLTERLQMIIEFAYTILVRFTSQFCNSFRKLYQNWDIRWCKVIVTILTLSFWTSSKRRSASVLRWPEEVLPEAGPEPAASSSFLNSNSLVRARSRSFSVSTTLDSFDFDFFFLWASQFRVQSARLTKAPTFSRSRRLSPLAWETRQDGYHTLTLSTQPTVQRVAAGCTETRDAGRVLGFGSLNRSSTASQWLSFLHPCSMWLEHRQSPGLWLSRQWHSLQRTFGCYIIQQRSL